MNFSERIWKNKDKLINEVHTTLTQNILRGQDPQKAIDTIAKKMQTSKYNAGRLVMTEEAYFSSAAQKEAFAELGVEQYEIVATLDTHTSDICRSLDGKVYPMKDYQAGVTAPPFHVWCRSTTAPYFEDDFGEIGERAARDENGKTYSVPADMTYAEWEKAFAEGDKNGLKKRSRSDIMELKKEIANADIQIIGLKNQISDITKAAEPDAAKLKDIAKKLKDLIQKKTQWKSQLPVLGGQGTPLSITDALKGANPRFAKGTQYAVNCQRCVQAYELRRRGYNVEALPKPKKKNTIA